MRWPELGALIQRVPCNEVSVALSPRQQGQTKLLLTHTFQHEHRQSFDQRLRLLDPNRASNLTFSRLFPLSLDLVPDRKTSGFLKGMLGKSIFDETDVSVLCQSSLMRPEIKLQMVRPAPKAVSFHVNICGIFRSTPVDNIHSLMVIKECIFVENRLCLKGDESLTINHLLQYLQTLKTQAYSECMPKRCDWIDKLSHLSIYEQRCFQLLTDMPVQESSHFLSTSRYFNCRIVAPLLHVETRIQCPLQNQDFFSEIDEKTQLPAFTSQCHSAQMPHHHDEKSSPTPKQQISSGTCTGISSTRIEEAQSALLDSAMNKVEGPILRLKFPLPVVYSPQIRARPKAFGMNGGGDAILDIFTQSMKGMKQPLANIEHVFQRNCEKVRSIDNILHFMKPSEALLSAEVPPRELRRRQNETHFLRRDALASTMQNLTSVIHYNASHFPFAPSDVLAVLPVVDLLDEGFQTGKRPRTPPVTGQSKHPKVDNATLLNGENGTVNSGFQKDTRLVDTSDAHTSTLNIDCTDNDPVTNKPAADETMEESVDAFVKSLSTRAPSIIQGKREVKIQKLGFHETKVTTCGKIVRALYDGCKNTLVIVPKSSRSELLNTCLQLLKPRLPHLYESATWIIPESWLSSALISLNHFAHGCIGEQKIMWGDCTIGVISMDSLLKEELFDIGCSSLVLLMDPNPDLSRLKLIGNVVRRFGEHGTARVVTLACGIADGTVSFTDMCKDLHATSLILCAPSDPDIIFLNHKSTMYDFYLSTRLSEWQLELERIIAQTVEDLRANATLAHISLTLQGIRDALKNFQRRGNSKLFWKLMECFSAMFLHDSLISMNTAGVHKFMQKIHQNAKQKEVFQQHSTLRQFIDKQDEFIQELAEAKRVFLEGMDNLLHNVLALAFRLKKQFTKDDFSSSTPPINILICTKAEHGIQMMQEVVTGVIRKIAPELAGAQYARMLPISSHMSTVQALESLQREQGAIKRPILIIIIPQDRLVAFDTFPWESLSSVVLLGSLPEFIQVQASVNDRLALHTIECHPQLMDTESGLTNVAKVSHFKTSCKSGKSADHDSDLKLASAASSIRELFQHPNSSEKPIDVSSLYYNEMTDVQGAAPDKKQLSLQLLFGEALLDFPSVFELLQENGVSLIECPIIYPHLILNDETGVIFTTGEELDVNGKVALQITECERHVGSLHVLVVSDLRRNAVDYQLLDSIQNLLVSTCSSALKIRVHLANPTSLWGLVHQCMADVTFDDNSVASLIPSYCQRAKFEHIQFLTHFGMSPRIARRVVLQYGLCPFLNLPKSSRASTFPWIPSSVQYAISAIADSTDECESSPREYCTAKMGHDDGALGFSNFDVQHLPQQMAAKDLTLFQGSRAMKTPADPSRNPFYYDDSIEGQSQISMHAHTAHLVTSKDFDANAQTTEEHRAKTVQMLRQRRLFYDDSDTIDGQTKLCWIQQGAEASVPKCGQGPEALNAQYTTLKRTPSTTKKRKLRRHP